MKKEFFFTRNEFDIKNIFIALIGVFITFTISTIPLYNSILNNKYSDIFQQYSTPINLIFIVGELLFLKGFFQYFRNLRKKNNYDIYGKIKDELLIFASIIASTIFSLYI